MELAGAITDVLRQFYGGRSSVDAVYVFGSFAAGSARPTSDIDVAVLYAQTPQPSLNSPPYDDQVALERQLKRVVDLVPLNTASADLVHRVLASGTLVVENNRSRRTVFEVASRNRYFDLAPLRKRYRAGVPESVP
jgi:uncharacterized protein